MRDIKDSFIKSFFVFVYPFFVEVCACSIVFRYIDRFIDVEVGSEEAVVKPMESGCGSRCLGARGILISV